VAAGDARRLADLLGLSDEELCSTLGISPLEIVSGDGDSVAAVPILLDLLAEAEERAGEAVLRRWVRTRGSAGVPVDLLTSRDFAAFEDALADLVERGFVIGGPRD
jgi:hypothetical protein